MLKAFGLIFLFVCSAESYETKGVAKTLDGKTVLYTETVPETRFEDLRFKKKEELIFAEDGKQIFIKIIKDGKAEEKKLELKKNMVVGQGFDNFIKINFENLIKNSISIFFGVLAKLDFYDFTAQTRNVSSKNATFGINFSNLFLSFFVSGLQVEYDKETNQLIIYKGLSNLPDDSGKDQSVLIQYEKLKP